MKSLVKFPLEEGGFIIVEVEEPELEGALVPASPPGELLTEAGLKFDQVLESLRPALNFMILKLRDLISQPDEMTLEFGLKLNGKLGAIFASTSLESNFNVKLNWKK